MLAALVVFLLVLFIKVKQLLAALEVGHLCGLDVGGGLGLLVEALVEFTYLGLEVVRILLLQRLHVLTRLHLFAQLLLEVLRIGLQLFFDRLVLVQVLLGKLLVRFHVGEVRLLLGEEFIYTI